MMREILERPVGWLLTHLFFLGGIGITAAGLLALVRLFDRPITRKLGIAGVLINGGGVLTWAVAVYFRVTLPSPAVVDAGTAPPLFVAAMTGWIYQLFADLTLSSFVAIGAGLVMSGSMIRVGVYTVVASVLVAAAFVAVGDLPLLGYYVVTAPVGVSLMRRATREGRRDDNEATRGQPVGFGLYPLSPRDTGEVDGFEPRKHTVQQRDVLILTGRSVTDFLFRT